jgi:hypothetical protein
MSEDWFQETSTEAIEKEREAKKARYERTHQRRVWLPPPDARRNLPGGEFEGIFLDDQPKAIHEHNLFINGTRKDNWWTCIHKLNNKDRPELKPFWGGCPLCQSGDESYYIAFVTILDVTGFTVRQGKDKGKHISNLRKLLPLKLDGVEWLNKEKKIRKSLIGAKYNFCRTKKQQAVYGDASFIDKVDLNSEEFKTVGTDGKVYDPVPFDYRQVLAPQPRQDLLTIVQQMKEAKESAAAPARGRSRAQPDEDEGHDENGDSDDDIPF